MVSKWYLGWPFGAAGRLGQKIVRKAGVQEQLHGEMPGLGLQAVQNWYMDHDPVGSSRPKHANSGMNTETEMYMCAYIYIHTFLCAHKYICIYTYVHRELIS